MKSSEKDSDRFPSTEFDYTKLHQLNEGSFSKFEFGSINPQLK